MFLPQREDSRQRPHGVWYLRRKAATLSPRPVASKRLRYFGSGDLPFSCGASIGPPLAITVRSGLEISWGKNPGHVLHLLIVPMYQPIRSLAAKIGPLGSQVMLLVRVRKQIEKHLRREEVESILVRPHINPAVPNHALPAHPHMKTKH